MQKKKPHIASRRDLRSFSETANEAIPKPTETSNNNNPALLAKLPFAGPISAQLLVKNATTVVIVTCNVNRLMKE